MKIYTKTGDQGYTSLIGGTRVIKSNARIESYGTIDEVNSYVGLIATSDIAESQKHILKEIQDRLFTIGSSLAADPGRSQMVLPGLHVSDIELLEKEIDKMDEMLPPLKNFIIPGGNQTAAFCHVARCVCRRAERIVVFLAQDSQVEANVIIYLNRLSDYLFILARKISYDNNVPENLWLPKIL